jgi:hypothetical protein
VEKIIDRECSPDQEALADFGITPCRERCLLTTDFWRNLTLSHEKAADLRHAQRQREAVDRLIKEDLAQKLQKFNILYFVTFFLFASLGAVASRYVPALRQPEKFKIILGSNGIYFGFLMLLSLLYELKLSARWYFSLGTLILLASSPLVYDEFLAAAATRPLFWPVVATMLLLLTCFFIIFHKRKGLLARLSKIRQRNEEERLKRAEFERRISKLFSIHGKSIGAWVRRSAIKSAANILYSVLSCEACVDPKSALEDFKSQHRFKDPMGRLGTAVWTAAALVYMFLPTIPEVEAVPAVAASVLPVYAASMLIMDQLDEVRDRALDDVIKLIRSGRSDLCSR